MFDTSKFHEREDFSLRLPSVADRERVTSRLETLGFVVDYESDFAYLPRGIEDTPWQSSDVTQVEFFLEDAPSDYPERVDRLTFNYLLATLPEETISTFTDVVRSCMDQLGGQLTHRGRVIDPADLPTILKQYADELRDELADEPGSDFVARMVYEFMPRG